MCLSTSRRHNIFLLVTISHVRVVDTTLLVDYIYIVNVVKQIKCTYLRKISKELCYESMTSLDGLLKFKLFQYINNIFI